MTIIITIIYIYSRKQKKRGVSKEVFRDYYQYYY
eukprot:CAMPEP_0170515820 /NCGR_PEP_ID=MMETSP0209-20121228/2221_1 /TAXON_ID=665100 ORGANISM="Litonotus pictus, Strain P1" /NCGR_SAMPLE_ID=MMETSP0209 /ASSEMBLY_ACC=CAM_ASM_000301 /LENGTH=33 /DNA_ID= /DNA_START= /DNA_END= /DNA_ORIENTATION=